MQVMTWLITGAGPGLLFVARRCGVCAAIYCMITTVNDKYCKGWFGILFWPPPVHRRVLDFVRDFLSFTMRLSLPSMLVLPAVTIAATAGGAWTHGFDELEVIALQPRAYNEANFTALPACAQECVNTVCPAARPITSHNIDYAAPYLATC